MKVSPEVPWAGEEAGQIIFTMSKLHEMRALVNQMLTTAIETLFVEFQKTITEYDNEIVRLKEENDRKGKLLDRVLDPVGYLHNAGAYILKDMFFHLFRFICVFSTVRILIYVVNTRVWSFRKCLNRPYNGRPCGSL